MAPESAMSDDRIEHLRALGPNWDSYGAVPIKGVCWERVDG